MRGAERRPAGHVDEGRHSGRKLVGGDVGAVVVCVEVEAPEEGLVQHLAGAFTCLAVELLGVGEQVDQVGEGVTSRVEVGTVGVVELPGEASALVADARGAAMRSRRSRGRWQGKSGVGVKDSRLDACDWQVRQLARVVLAPLAG